MTTQNERVYLGDVLKWEANACFTREKITLAQDAVVTVLTEGVQSGMNRFNSKQPNHN